MKLRGLEVFGKAIQRLAAEDHLCFSGVSTDEAIPQGAPWQELENCMRGASRSSEE